MYLLSNCRGRHLRVYDKIHKAEAAATAADPWMHRAIFVIKRCFYNEMKNTLITSLRIFEIFFLKLLI